jgi:hypothetical protein
VAANRNITPLQGYKPGRPAYRKSDYVSIFQVEAQLKKEDKAKSRWNGGTRRRLTRMRTRSKSGREEKGREKKKKEVKLQKADGEPENTAVGIRHADHVAPCIRKSWQSLRRQAAVARSV